MWEFECHDWKTLRGFGSDRDVPLLLERVLGSSNEEEWNSALQSLTFYASHSNATSEATKAVVACLVAIAIRTEGPKLSAVLGTLEELCAPSVDEFEEYTPQELTWLREAGRELACALHTWAHLAETASTLDATYCVELLAYCATFVPELEAKVLKYLQLCRAARPELEEEISALLVNFNEMKRLFSERERA